MMLKNTWKSFITLNIAREIGDRFGEDASWFNLGLSLENLNGESDALDAYRQA